MRYKVTLTFLEPVLGTAPLDKEIYSTYIAEQTSKANGDEEVASIREDKGKTGFHRDEQGRPFIYDYLCKGFFKAACSMNRRIEGSESSKIKAFKKIIDGLVFIRERRLFFDLAGEMGELQRPLRAETPQGERVALACSETVPAGSKLTFTVEVLDDKTVPQSLLEEWLYYGRYNGLGQWRNARYGSFEYTLEPLRNG